MEDVLGITSFICGSRVGPTLRPLNRRLFFKINRVAVFAKVRIVTEGLYKMARARTDFKIASFVCRPRSPGGRLGLDCEAFSTASSAAAPGPAQRSPGQRQLVSRLVRVFADARLKSARRDGEGS